MNIKSLLLGSAAALSAVTGAHAADAIVAAEPEALEYVKVCDAFGKGYFYIPGTETCLKIGGYVRAQIDFSENSFGVDPDGNGPRSQKGDYGAFGRGYLTFEGKSDTELGALTGYINLQFDDAGKADVKSILDGAWINVAGFDVGYFYNWWDDGLSGETDELGSDRTLQNSIRYTYDGGAFTAGVAVEELTNKWATKAKNFSTSNDDIGVSGKLGATLGGIKIYGLASYDFNAEEAAFRVLATADIGPGTFGIGADYATDPNYYYSKAEWAIAAEYAIKASDKLTITPAGQYFVNLKSGSTFGNADAYKVGVTGAYQITDGLKTVATVNYYNPDGPKNDKWTGFLRLQRDF